jgi:phospholipase C
LAQLARDYVVCTRWHSSVPGATWPNRNFVHAATSDESVDIELGFYRDRTIFELLDREDTASPRPTWRIYHHDTPQVIAFDRLWKNGRWRRWFDAGQLLDDVRAGTLPNYSFVEPCHTGTKANSQHPENNETIVSDDFERGDQLVASIYNALVANDDLFRQTVLVVTYDEHGGFFDHVPPPRAVHPDAPGNRRRSREISRRLVSKFVEYGNRPFPFTHLGVRVPAVVVSPWVQDHTVDDTVYDHASIVASLRRLFAPTAEPLSRRDRHANDFLHLLAAREDNDEPMTPAPCTAYNDTPGALAAAIGTDPADLEVDAAARGEPAAQVLLKDDFAAQLDQLNHLVRSELTTAAGDDVLPTAAGDDPVPTAADDEALPTAPLDDPLAATGEAEPVPTAALFKAGADSTRDGNPSLDDF